METKATHHVMYIDHHTTRRALEVLAGRNGLNVIALGLHTTDLVAGLLNGWLTGYSIAGIPSRKVGDVTYAYPLAFVHKRELHLNHLRAVGKLARHSQPNPWERNPLDRNFYYYLADQLQAHWPGIETLLFTGHAVRLRSGQPTPRYERCRNCGAAVLHQPFTPVNSEDCDVCHARSRVQREGGAMTATRHSPHRRLPVINEAVLEPLGIAGGRAVLRAGEEFVFSNDELLDPLQSYPGEQLPEAGARTRRFPPRGAVLLPRALSEAAQVHGPVGALGETRAVRPGGALPRPAPRPFRGHLHPGLQLHVSALHAPGDAHAVGGGRRLGPEVERRDTMHPDGLKRAIDQVASMRADEQMGIVWGGGDPTANPFTYDGMLYARRLGFTSSFLTNGVFLEVDRVLDANPILVRISLNCGTEENYRRFHGYPAGWDYFDRVRLKMRELARRKQERRAHTLIGISLIVDERNMDDLLAAAEEIRAVVDEVGPGIDYVICRPVMNYAHFEGRWAQIGSDTKRRAQEALSEGGAVWVLRELHIPLVPIKDSFEEPPQSAFYGDTQCLAYGVCGEIRHNGDVQLCSDSYGSPEYTIGNLFEQTLEEIWRSPRRREVLDRINAKECYKNVCPHNSRGHHHNRVFHQIEEKRQAGQMETVRQWVRDLQETTYPLNSIVLSR